LLFHFQEKQAVPFFGFIQDNLHSFNLIFQTIFGTFIKDRDKSLNAMKLPYFNTKLEVTNNLIKIIKRNAPDFRNFDNFKIRIFIVLNIKKEKTKMVLSRC